MKRHPHPFGRMRRGISAIAFMHNLSTAGRLTENPLKVERSKTLAVEQWDGTKWVTRILEWDGTSYVDAGRNQ